MATIDRRTFVGAVAAVAAATALPSLVLGQDSATPSAPGTETSALSSLGLPALAVTVANDGITVESTATAGTTLLTVTNQTEGFSSFMLVQPAEGVTDDDIAASIDPNAPMPEWLFESTLTGGLELEPGQAGEVGVELLAGTWYLVNVGEFPSFTTLVVDGEFAEVVIEPAVAVLMHHHLFEIPSEVTAGSQVWQVTNEDAVLHHMILFTYPEAIDAEQFLGLLLASDGMASPPADLDPSLVMPVGATGLQSQGVTTWVSFDLAPGNYQATCFVADPGSEVPHAAEGMIATFTVA